MSRSSIVTIGVLIALGSMPMLSASESFHIVASDAAAERSIVSGFIRPGGSFDTVAFMNDVCYSIVGDQEAEKCARIYGRYAPLKETQSDGTLQVILRKYGASTPSPTVTASEMPAPAHVANQPSKVDAVRAIQQNRVDTAWNNCKLRYSTPRDIAACYQGNARLVFRRLDAPLPAAFRKR